MQNVRDVQIALRQRGYDPGPADGILGRRTIAAIKEFQKEQKLFVDGIAGSATLSRLFPTGSDKPEAAILVPWYAEASRLMGTREVVGKKHSPIIMGWAEKLGLWYPSDETAWCGLYVAHCIGATLPNEPLPANPLGARNWAKFGRPLDRPAVGAVAAFWRGSKSGWLGHVGFIKAVSADGKSLEIRGGNQNNSVSDAWLSADRLLDDGIRWPSTAPLPAGSRIPTSTVGGKLSVSEA
ncbi:TIGR02594 family protein [Microvirga sp. RSM25]|uniref:NlpC/P60 family protein n=1 Tax=Microvirga sp. RSM25 TaxID=3273802 RepID=UPI00384C7832